MRNERLLVEHGGHWRLSDLIDMLGLDDEDFAVWCARHGGWWIAHGDENAEYSKRVTRSGYVQGDVIQIHHNDLTAATINLIASLVFDGVYTVTLQRWNPAVGCGWESVDSINGIEYDSEPEHWAGVANDYFGTSFTAEDVVMDFVD